MYTVDIALVNRFPILSLSLVTEPLRVANREMLDQVFRWRVLSPDGKPVTSSSGFTLAPDAGLDAGPADAVLLLASYRAEDAALPALLSWLHRRAGQGAMMGCVDTGAVIFAKAGLLETRQAAVHHETYTAYRSDFRGLQFTDRIFDFAPPRCSSAGGVGTLDMTLALVAHVATPAIARRVERVLNYRPHAPDAGQALFDRDHALATVDRDLARCVEIMQTHLEDPLALSVVSVLAQVPSWRMRRLFAKFLGTTPRAHYLGLRLDRARDLLRNGHARVDAVAVACGFDAPETFSRAYKRRFSVSPSRDRDWGRLGGLERPSLR